MELQAVDELRAHVHRMWSGVASRWADNADDVDRRGAEVAERMLEAAAVRPGDRVLELACGPGGAGLAAAARVGSGGEVVLSDVVPEMTSIAAARARNRGLDNVRTATLDLEQIDEPDGSYDIVLCREGLMFAVQPDCAVNEMHRVLRPGGRLAIAVWGSQGANPWLGIVFDALTSIMGSTVPPPGVPGPFALDDDARLGNLMQAAGFVDIAIDHIPTPLRSPTFEAWWARTGAVAGPVAAIIARLDPTTKIALEQRVRASAAPYMTTTGLQFPGLTVLASARRT